MSADVKDVSMAVKTAGMTVAVLVVMLVGQMEVSMADATAVKLVALKVQK